MFFLVGSGELQPWATGSAADDLERAVQTTKTSDVTSSEKKISLVSGVKDGDIKNKDTKDEANKEKSKSEIKEGKTEENTEDLRKRTVKI